MAIKNVIKEEFSNKETLIKLRYNSSKLVFVLVTLLFFLNLFLYSSWLYTKFFQISVSISYFLLIFSLDFLAYYYLSIKFAEKLTKNKKKSYVLIFILALISIMLLYPVLVKNI